MIRRAKKRVTASLEEESNIKLLFAPAGVAATSRAKPPIENEEACHDAAGGEL